MTRQEIALNVAIRAIARSGADGAAIAPNTQLASIVPAYLRSGKPRVAYWLNHSIKGLNVTVSDLHEWLTVSMVIDNIASRLNLAPNLYRCSDPIEPHYYLELGNGLCEIDNTPLTTV